MRIDRQDLPGVGVLHVFTTRAGQRVGVIQRRDGRRILAIYRDDDPQAVHRAATFDAQEAHDLVDLLHPVLTVEHIDPAPNGPCVARLRVLAGSQAVGQAISSLDTPDARIVAVIRDGTLTGRAHPSIPVRGGDTVIAAGTVEGINTMAGQLGAAEPGLPAAL